MHRGHCRVTKHLETLKIVEDAECKSYLLEGHTATYLLSDYYALRNPRAQVQGVHEIEAEDLSNLIVFDIIHFLKGIVTEKSSTTARRGSIIGLTVAVQTLSSEHTT